MIETTTQRRRDYRWTQTIGTILLVVLCIGISAPCHAQDRHAGVHTYLFHGHFAPTDRAATPQAVYFSPSELMGQPFTIAVSWPANADAYSPDWQTGADYWGSYNSTSISINIDAPGFEFSVPPTIASWETWNDTVLEYSYGVPQMWGDELRLIRRVDWARTFQDELDSGPFTWVTHYQLSLRAVDPAGAHFVDDSLQTEFDLTTFADVRFEFQQSIPVESGDPRPIHSDHWFGIVDSIVAIPEPTSCGLASLAVFFAVLCRRLISCALFPEIGCIKNTLSRVTLPSSAASMALDPTLAHEPTLLTHQL